MIFLQENWRRRLRLASLLVLVFFGLISLVSLASLAMAPWLKTQLETRASSALGRQVRVGELVLHPWALSLQLNDLRLATADGGATQFSVDSFLLDLSLQSVWRLAPVLDALRIDKPQLHLSRQADGRLDIDDLLQRFAGPSKPAEPDQKPLQFALYNVELSGGSVDLQDQFAQPARTHQLRGLTLALPFLSNLDAQREVRVQPKLAFELNGSRFDSSAQATPFASSRAADLELRISDFEATPYLPYLPAKLPVQLRTAQLDTDLKVHFAQTPQAQLSVSGSLQLSKVRLAAHAAGNEDFLQFDSLQIELDQVRPLEHFAGIKSVTLNAPRVRLSRSADGRLSPDFSASSKAPVAEKKPASAEAGWKVELEAFHLQNGNVQWHDQSTAPAAALQLTDAGVTLKNLHWPMEAAKPAAFSADFALGPISLATKPEKGRPKNASKNTAKIGLQGSGTAHSGHAELQIDALNLPIAAPYLSSYLVPSVRGQLQARLAAEWNGDAVQLQVPEAVLRDFALVSSDLDASANARQMPAFKSLALKDVRLDVPARSARVGQLSLQSPSLRVQRETDGQWMFSRWIKAQPATPSAGAAGANATGAAAPAWKINLADLRLDSGSLVYADQQTVKPARLALSELSLHAQNLSGDGRTPASVQVRANVRSGRTDPGRLQFDGNLMWNPVQAQGQLELVDFPAHFVAPYLMEQMHVELLRADLSFKGPLRYSAGPQGMSVQLRGDAALEDFQANSFRSVQRASAASGQAPQTEGSEELLSWKALSVPGIDLNLQPGAPLQLRTGEIALTDFFARLIVSADGRLVLQDLVPAKASDSRPAPLDDAGPPPQIEAGPLRLANGRVAFSDRFIKPNYSAELSALNGSLGRVSTLRQNGVVPSATLDLHGRAEGSALLDIGGRLNPLARPLALDIRAKVSDLELSPLSSYSVKYAGYGIQRGKLSADLSYLVQPDGQLTAGNHILLNQLTFGDAVPDAPASLPVKLVTALLSDSDGMINLDLPVSGSMNDPQFSIGPVIWKVLGNLMTKAITSPFSLFSMGGGDGGEDALSNIGFEPGSARITESGRRNLERIAAELRGRPALLLTIVGSASLEAEAEAIRKDQLRTLLLGEKRRQAANSGKNLHSVNALEALTEQELPELLKEVYRHADIKKPRNLIGISKELPPEQMEALLLDSLKVTPETVRSLAFARSIAVRDFLSANALPVERLFLGVEKTPVAGADWVPQAELSLSHH